ncbi:efflux RND transporter periplasmic adaptor subunit [Rhizobium beringeri]
MLAWQFSLAAKKAATLTLPLLPPPVRVAQPVQQPITLYFELTGNTAPLNSVDIEARVQGYIKSIDYQDGMTVTKGTKLFESSATPTRPNWIKRRHRSPRNRRLRSARSRNMTDSSICRSNRSPRRPQSIAPRQRSTRRMHPSSTLRPISISRRSTSDIRRCLPFDGTVTDHLVDIGALVGVSGPTKLASIVQTDPLYAYFNVSETQVLMIKETLARQGHTFKQTDLPSIPAELGLQTEEGYPHKGHLDYVSPQLDASTGTLQVRALFDNKDRAMLPGLFVRVRVPVGHNDKALLVRDDAIGTNQLGSYLLVLGKDDVVEQKQVKTGQREGALRVIDSGLDPGRLGRDPRYPAGHPRQQGHARENRNEPAGGCRRRCQGQNHHAMNSPPWFI